MLESLLAGPATALAVAIALSLLVAWESVYPPWAPYFLIYAGLAIAIPVAAGTCVFGSPWGTVSGAWREMALAGAGMACWEIGLFHWVYEVWWLRRIGRADDPGLSVPAAIRSLLRLAERRTGIDPARAELIFAGYTLVWAPIGEEFFYWGYLFEVTRPAWGFPTASVVTASLFAFRHAVHFLYLGKRTPFIPAACLALSAFASGLLNSWLYEQSGSLWPLILLHILMNLLWVASLKSGNQRPA
ncbi:MAG: CPBP family intramembrane glutamic endopeptidase [Fibrobacteria bacterium]